MLVGVIDDEPVYVVGLRKVLYPHAIVLMSHVKPLELLMESIRSLGPDVVIVNLSLLPSDVLGIVARQFQDTKLVCLVDEPLSGLSPRGLPEAGIDGMITRQSEGMTVRRLVSQLELAGDDRFCESQTILSASPVSGGQSLLTVRQQEVMLLLQSGVTTTTGLARELSVSESTVKYHIHCLLELFDVSNRAELIARVRMSAVLKERDMDDMSLY